MACAYLVMVQYSLEQRVFIYNTYIRKKSIKKCRTKLRKQFPGISVPYKSTIQKLKKLQTTGSLLDKKHVLVKKELTEDKLDDIGARLEHSQKNR